MLSEKIQKAATPKKTKYTCSQKASAVAFILNSFLFLLKMSTGIISGSIALISDAIHSLMDVLSALILAVGVRVSQQGPDHDHPFGHHRAEPIAALIIAVIAGILAFEILRESVMKLILGSEPIKGNIAIYALLITIFFKAIMTFYFKLLYQKERAPSIRAFILDSKNDLLASLVSLLGVMLTTFQLNFFDPIAGIIVAGFIFKGGYEIAMENIDFLMGKKGDEQTNEKIREAAQSIDNVLGTNTLLSHHVGNTLHVEVHIEVEHSLETSKSHGIADLVENAIEKMPEVSRAFVHVDPVRVNEDGTREYVYEHEGTAHLD